MWAVAAAQQLEQLDRVIAVLVNGVLSQVGYLCCAWWLPVTPLSVMLHLCAALCCFVLSKGDCLIGGNVNQLDLPDIPASTIVAAGQGGEGGRGMVGIGWGRSLEGREQREGCEGREGREGHKVRIGGLTRGVDTTTEAAILANLYGAKPLRDQTCWKGYA